MFGSFSYEKIISFFNVILSSTIFSKFNSFFFKFIIIFFFLQYSIISLDILNKELNILSYKLTSLLNISVINSVQDNNSPKASIPICFCQPKYVFSAYLIKKEI